MKYELQVRSQHAKGQSRGFAGPDTYVAVMYLWEALDAATRSGARYACIKIVDHRTAIVIENNIGFYSLHRCLVDATARSR